MFIVWMAWANWRGHFSQYGFRAVSFGSVSKLLSITKMLKFNSATKHVFTYYETRKAYSWHSHQIETAIHSELQLAVAFVFDVPDAVTKRASTYHRSAFPIAIERADITSSILDFQVGGFQLYDTTCFVFSFSLYWLNRCPFLESRLCVCRYDKTYSVATKQVATKSLCSMTCLGLGKTINSKPRLIEGTGRRLLCTKT